MTDVFYYIIRPTKVSDKNVTDTLLKYWGEQHNWPNLYGTQLQLINIPYSITCADR